jgi:hypothetical protein
MMAAIALPSMMLEVIVMWGFSGLWLWQMLRGGDCPTCLLCRLLVLMLVAITNAVDGGTRRASTKLIRNPRQ